VIFGLPGFGIGEKLGWWSIIHRTASAHYWVINHHISSKLGNARQLLHIMRDNYNRISLL